MFGLHDSIISNFYFAVALLLVFHHLFPKINLFCCFCLVPAVISTSPQKIYLIRKGSDVTIQCSAFGNPRPSLIWRHSMNTSSARYREEVTEAEFSIEKKITIQNVTARDAGNFTCITANSVGSIGRGTGRVIVQGNMLYLVTMLMYSLMPYPPFSFS